MSMNMKNTFRAAAYILALCGLISSVSYGQQKLAQTGMKFLNVGADARMSALAGAGTSIDGYAGAMFYNPASMARLNNPVNVSIGKVLWLADIDHTYGSVAFSPSDGDYGVFGVSVQAVDYGDIQETIRSNNAQGYLDLGTFKPSALALGLGYARALSDKFSFGGNMKFVKQYLGNAVTSYSTTGGIGRSDSRTEVLAFDLGVLYKTGFKSLNFGMTVRNFSKEIRFEEENFQLPLTFKIGLGMNLLDMIEADREQHALLLLVEAEHPRDFPEQVRVGAEYVFMDAFSFRAGYVAPTDVEGISLGVGHHKQYGEKLWFAFDYAYTPFGILGNVHRFSFQFAF